MTHSHAQFLFCTDAYLAGNFKSLLSHGGLPVSTLVVTNVQAMASTDVLLAASVCPSIERLFLTGTQIKLPSSGTPSSTNSSPTMSLLERLATQKSLHSLS